MNKIIPIFLLLCISTVMHAQQKASTIQQIETTIQNYYDGYIYRDIEKLNKAFDTENGTMKVPVKKGEKIMGFKNTYFKDLMPIWGHRKKLGTDILKHCELTILNIDVVDSTIASAKISMKVDTITYIDILSLEIINGDWKITNKIYVTRKG